MPHPQSLQFQRASVALTSALADFIEGKTGVIEVSRIVSSLRFELVGDTLDEEWRTFVGIASETDQFPIGPVRAHWEKAALSLKDSEAAQFEALYHETAVHSARILLMRYGRFSR